MANWDDIINNRLTMGRARQLCYAMNAERRRRENGEEERRPGVMPLLGRGIRPVVPWFQHWDGFWEENFNYNDTSFFLFILKVLWLVKLYCVIGFRILKVSG